MWHKIRYYFPSLPSYVKVLISTIAWLIFISWLHFHLNADNESRKVIKMGYMPVITNLAAPLLDYASLKGDGVRYKALKFSSFAEMAEALRNEQIDVAFMIAPLSIVLRQQGEDVKVVYIGNRHESTMVTRKDLKVDSIHDLIGKTIGVPMRYSGHNISLLKMIEEKNLTGQINIVEMNPPDMAAAVTSGALDGYYVGEPFAAQTLRSGHSNKFIYAEEVWENFICNLMVVKNSLIEQQPQAVQALVSAAVRSGLWAGENQKEAAKIASSYWNQDIDLLNYAFTSPSERTRYDLYMPKEKEMQEIADLMKSYNLLESSDVSGLVDDQFTRSVALEEISSIESILK